MKGIELISMLMSLIVLIVITAVILLFLNNFVEVILKSVSSFFNAIVDNILGMLGFGFGHIL